MTESASSSAPSLPAALVRAQAQTQAALAIAYDGAAPAWTADTHVHAAIAALAEHAGARDPDADASAGIDLLKDRAPAWCSSEDLPTWAALSTATADDRDARRTAAQSLARTVQRASAEILGPTHVRARRAWLRNRIIAAVLVTAGVVVGLALTTPDYREGPWHGRYFPNRDFTGEPLVRRDGDLNFDWEDQGPQQDFVTDDFSARWDTCLEIDEPTTATFQLVSDDGSRLFIDGALVVDNWGSHSERARGGSAALEPGVHHLRVEYYDARKAASMELVGSLHGERPTALPAKVLHHPGLDMSEDDPCASVRAERAR